MLRGLVKDLVRMHRQVEEQDVNGVVFFPRWSDQQRRARRLEVQNRYVLAFALRSLPKGR
jgi:hypothetical protein